MKSSPAKAWARALELTTPIASHPSRLLPTVIDEAADKYGDGPALLGDNECFSYRALVARSNQYARWALDQGLAKGDIVGLLMPNRPEYLAVWLGITRVGGIVALLNTNLVGASLAHSVNLVATRHVIADSGHVETLTAAVPDLARSATIWVHGAGGNGFRRIDRDIDTLAGDRLQDAETRATTIDDPALLVYTSGTTGMPKAAIITHARVMQWSHWFCGLMDTRPADRMYNCLPLYHSVGGVQATGAMLVGGGSLAVREKFSASHFWKDIVRWDCTLFQYIGELCRYLLHTDVQPEESLHRIRLCCGNGLRQDIWSDFQGRFRIPQILEFYAATEGNVSFFNVEGKPGAVGRIPKYLAHRFPATLVKFDARTEQPARNEAGRCTHCAPNEVGEAIGRLLGDRPNVGSRFDGYTSREASEKKILRDVFNPGDAWFRTGDLMRKDEEGYFYFVDRVGDTFRWKGENVATSEVSEAIQAFAGVRHVNVYGVAVPGADGRAGMAAIVADAPLDLAAFRAHLIRVLPDYGRPIFLRIRHEMEITVTFKQTKNVLVRQGYDPRSTADPMYVDAPGRGGFVALDQALYDRIQAGEIRF